MKILAVLLLLFICETISAQSKSCDFVVLNHNIDSLKSTRLFRVSIKEVEKRRDIKMIISKMKLKAYDAIFPNHGYLHNRFEGLCGLKKYDIRQIEIFKDTLVQNGVYMDVYFNKR